MAYLKNLFEFTGKLGNVVGYYYKGKHCVRRLPVRKNEIVSPAQMAHRKRFAVASKFVQCISPLLKHSISEHKRMSKQNIVMSHTMKNAITGNYPNFDINYSKVFISRGMLLNAWSEKARTESGNVLFTWKDNSIHHGCNGKADDKAILVVYCEALNLCIYSLNSINRSAGSATLPVLPFLGHKVETWIGFISANGKLISDSTYTGALYIT